jgi:anthranilate 3-monooxygenase (FAD)/4-hydroxyphenylacetate 3-monooxygenase
MPVRTGAQYVEALKKVKFNLYIEGRRVEDVTQEPLFQGPIQAIAELYDLQHDPRYKDVLTYPSPTTGDPVSVVFQTPRSHEELIKRRQALKLKTDHNFGMMGRSPDFTNGLVTGWYHSRELFARGGKQFGENAVKFYEYVRENDIFLTHTLVGPQVDRSRTASEQEDPFTQLGKVSETKEGIIVRGAKMLGTMAPLTEELLVVPFGGVGPGEHIYALAFAIPNDTPGVKFICRETVAPQPRSQWDHPLSSRFEEMDCIVIFDDVLVPWDRIMVPGAPESEDIVNEMRGSMAAQGANQSAAQHLSQMELMVGVAMKLADSIGIHGFLNIQALLGEMISYLEVARTVFYGTEALSLEGPDGAWGYTGFGTRAWRLQAHTVHRRMVEIIQTLAGGGFFQSATEADLANPELRPFIDKYMKGRPGYSAEERIQIFKLAWDLTGETFGQRIQQYVHFHSGDPYRNMAAAYVAYDKEPAFDLVDRALGKKDHLDIALTTENEGVRRVSKPEPGALRYSYPAASYPKPQKQKA